MKPALRETSRGLVCTELAGHHTSNDASVMPKRFKTDEIPKKVLKAAKTALQDNPEVLKAVLNASEDGMRTPLVRSFRVFPFVLSANVVIIGQSY
jgi:hypothetical protein